MVGNTNKQESKITVSVIKADIGGWVGHSAIHPALIENANGKLATAKTSGMPIGSRMCCVCMAPSSRTGCLSRRWSIQPCRRL